jgi:hypothetical protein
MLTEAAKEIKPNICFLPKFVLILNIEIIKLRILRNIYITVGKNEDI